MASKFSKDRVTKLKMEIQGINQMTKIFYNVKNEIISKFEDTKRQIRYYNQQKNYDAKLLSIVTRERIISLLDRDISQIQNLYDVIVQDLDHIKRCIEQHISIVEKTELVSNILNYKMYEIRFDFRGQFDKLKERQQKLIDVSKQGEEDPKTALEIVEITDELSKLEEDHQNELDSIKEQKIDAQKSYERAVQVMDDYLEKMSNGFNKLLILIEAEKSVSGDSKSSINESKFSAEIERLKSDIDKYTQLQTIGWKMLYPEEKISELLQQRGLKILQPGLLINEEGVAISYNQAKNSKLLDNLDPNMVKEIKSALQENDVQSEPSEESVYSKMSSEDVNYLKEHLGKPLTLALAEITAIQPRDPIHYLAHWLFKYRYNQQTETVNSMEFDILNEKRTQLAREKWHKFVEDEAKAAVIDMIVQAEQIAIMNELRRIEQELEANEEMENYDDEARDILGTYNGPKTGKTTLN
ncbi:hypothetical protein GWI33_021786 [Rhynchophorus ferrugineus]|uniref:Uncharacterized protein n=1 Tax=Rhynchophorus ferrugineus TaxID=354439 RepID=A0A834HPA7_RHYFE|nr:hypothetical protein GWI33_021786 [Rhynchophorus ferrugineus]